MIYKKIVFLILFFLLSLLGTYSAMSYSSNQVMGDTIEGLMQDYFESGGWKSLQGQVGSQGIDGLFFKFKDGIIQDVLIVESKYNTSNLGDNLVCGGKQMSNEWVKCKLDNLIKNAQKNNDNANIQKYEQIKKHIENNNYRSRLWRAELKDGQLNIDVQNIKSNGTDVELEELKGGSKHKIQYSGNQSIDLKNPKNEFHKKIVDNFFKKMDDSMAKQGISTAERSSLIEKFKKDPHKINDIIREYTSSIKQPLVKVITNSKSATESIVKKSTTKVSKQVTKRVTKGFFKNIIKNIKTGVSGAAAGSALGPIGATVGFIGGIAAGIAMDYLVDTAVDNAFGSDKVSADSNSLDKYRQEIEKSALSMQEKIQTVHKRLEEEFTVLGDDLQKKHEAEMDAIQTNLKEIIKVGQGVDRIDQKVDSLRTDLKSFSNEMLNGIQVLSIKLKDIDSTLISLSVKIDKIYERLDASMKANFDSGVEALELFDNTKEVQHLERAIDYFREFKNTFLRINNRTKEEEDLLSLTKYYLAAVYADIYSIKKNVGYAKSSVNAFIELSEDQPDLNFITMTYMSIKDADSSGIAGKKIYDFYFNIINKKFQDGDYNQAKLIVESLHLMLDNQDTAKLRDEVINFISIGINQNGILDIKDSSYRTLLAYIAKGQIPDYKIGLPNYITHILSGSATPEDFYKLMEKYKSYEVTRFAIRTLKKNNYFNDALKILQQYPVGDDIFRVKAFLLLYQEINSPKFPELKKLVLNNPSYSKDVKDFATKMTN